MQGTAKGFRNAPEDKKKHRGGIKAVAMVQQTGYGCHKIFSHTGHRGLSKEIIGSNKIVLSEEGFSKTVIK